MSLKVYQYKSCGTCRKALAFLDQEGIAYEPIDIVTRPPSVNELREALKLSGVPLKKLFNTSGQSYRDGKFGERLAGMTETDALTALAKDGKLIKRPLVLSKDVALVGFDEAVYRQRLR